MDFITQKKIFENPMLHRFLRENSYWYKILNRDPDKIDDMIKDMKDKYKLNTSDKIERFGEKLTFVESILDVLK